MSLNCKQLKQKYEELLSERDKFVLEYEKFKNSGNSESFKKEIAKFEKKKQEIKEILKYPGIIYEHLKKLSKKHNIEFTDFENIHILSDGIMTGCFSMKDSTHDYIFVGDELVYEFGDITFEEFKEFLVKQNGDFVILLVEAVTGQNVLLEGNLLTREIYNKQVGITLEDLVLQPDGSVTWKEKRGFTQYPVVNGEVIEKVGGTRVFNDVRFFHKRPDGKWAGTVTGVKTLPFVGDNVLEKIEGEYISDAQDIHTQPNGDLAGRVKLGEKYYPFHGKTIVRDIEGFTILNTNYVATTPEGILVGQVKVQVNENSQDTTEKFEWRMFKGNTFVTELSGKEIGPIIEMKCDKYGHICGYYSINGLYRIFSSNEIFDTVSGKKIDRISRGIKILEDGSFYGDARVKGMTFHRTFIYNGEEYVFVDEINK